MSWRDYVYGHIAAEISRLTKYCEAVVQHEPLPHDNGLLLSLIECPSRTTSLRRWVLQRRTGCRRQSALRHPPEWQSELQPRHSGTPCKRQMRTWAHGPPHCRRLQPLFALDLCARIPSRRAKSRGAKHVRHSERPTASGQTLGF